ncbi:DNA replication ATP-dependent helicase/nuclease DNA2 [Takifugu rubripes]|uniref:DNA replication ATP-dependent helicase/nuclease n=1 Tax=Takifugu rubripes TaxID=31033 RepID=H2SI79_TAKRU|nr:DNA replication ATP-dependent helicase/nuclease DNA2 [Takifugu rubripes]|eukprot:XP_011607896.1 PREDICTED: DNA replication ATP-dependent helicase/nuclease DNA2 isoform X1 [Takifugu rubripes]
MNRTKLKKTTATGGQKNISSFFMSKNQLQDSTTLTKLPIALPAPAKPEPHINDETSTFIPNSPFKRNILGDIDNLLPSSPDLLYVPETPKSQMRLFLASSTEKSDWSPQACRPLSREPRIHQILSKDEGKTISHFSCTRKRLISPPQESYSAKKSMNSNGLTQTAHSLNIARPFNAMQSDVHNKGNEMFISAKRISETSIRNGTMENKTGYIFTQKTADSKACEKLNPHLHVNLHTGAGHMQKCNLTTATYALLKTAEKGGMDCNKKDAVRTEINSSKGDRDNGTSNPEGVRGVASACQLDEGLNECWFEEQMDDGDHVTEEKPQKPWKVPDHVILSGGLNNRYWVLDVEERPGLKTLTVSCSKTLDLTEKCLLKDGWEMTPVSIGDVVHLEGQSEGGSWLIDREKGFLVLLPDSLISGTSISSSIRCMRRAVLGDMFKSFDGGSKQMLNGTMVHDVFQKAATAKDFSSESLSKLASEALCSPQYLPDMYCLGVSQEEMKQELDVYLPSLEHWAKDYLNPTSPKAVSLKIPCNSRPPGKSQDATAMVRFTELVDIEENVWSPRFGLKGKIDVTAQVQIHRPRNGQNHRIQEERTIPLELKTGRESNSIEHRSQVILYTLMSLERYRPEAGFLLYLKNGNLHPVVPSHMDYRELLKLRNTLIHHIQNCVARQGEKSRLSRLPDILTNRQPCQYCPQRRNCALYERALDNTTADALVGVVRDFLQQETGHLTPPHLKYFSHWLLLCCLEAAAMETKNTQKKIWLQSPEESEKKGSCVGNMHISGPVVQSKGAFLHHFQRSCAVPQEGYHINGLVSGDHIVVSDQEGRFVGLATGFLCEVNKMFTSVSCTLDRDLSKFTGVLFRLDGYEGVVGLSTHLTNLSSLMENNQDSARLRELVVDLRPPEFICSLSSVLPRETKDTVASILKGLNKPQKQAMKKVLLSKDYTLIVGMPGTGKTTTICTLVRILYTCGFSVLLTSYTHSAVDNILLKLKRFRVGFLRLGQAQKVHPEILSYTEESARRRGVHSLSQLEQLYNKELVVGTTCMGIKHPIFTRRRFDFCIVDEASQISQPICIGPLFYAKRFVLVGDHQQLPPIVQNQEARSRGMDESLFKRLELHSEAVVQLNVQYRMNRQIMSLSNSLMYEGRLECGSERTATALITLPFLPSVLSELGSHSAADPQQDLAWIQATILPSNPVCFLDCSVVPALETVEQGGISNHTEAVVIRKLLLLLIKAGCKPSDIGVIAPYRQQLRTISGLLQSSVFTGVEVNTVDRYQGRDKSLIILSFVRSTTAEGTLGELLKDWRRLNVAITRAKNKLLMVGSATTLQRYSPVEKLLNHLQQENMIIQLPPAAHKALPDMVL